IQSVIKNTTTPSWINSVPSNYRETSAGTIKADEWHVLSTIYLPIALVTLWGDNNGQPLPDDSWHLPILDCTMVLFQAVTIICRYTMNLGQATTYRNLLKKCVDGLYSVHPHMQTHKERPNVHAAFHLYEFIISFEPVISWWCFSFECLFVTLQKININDHVGGKLSFFFISCVQELTSLLGELKTTMLQSFMKAANLHHYLSRPECPQHMQEFKCLLDNALPPKDQREVKFEADPPMLRQT
ncbi:uncharacterized protein EV420DRAFT_1270592, partial [Desarmillaria tabescens]